MSGNDTYVNPKCPNLSLNLSTISLLTPLSLSNLSNSCLSSLLALRPMGEMLTIPFLNSTNVPLLMGMSRSAM